MGEKKILIVHPYDLTTSFLEGIVSHLQSAFPEEIYYFQIETSDASHRKCLEIINKHTANGLIIFLGHGRSDKLYGSKGDEFYPDAGSDLIASFPDKYYFKEDFIYKGNIEVLAGKKVFCLACNSNDKIANYAFEKGVSSFIGFGDIPTSPSEFIGNCATGNCKEVAKLMRTELNHIITRSLAIAITNNYTFIELKDLLEFIATQRITDYLINNKSFDDRFILADNLYFLKKHIKITGDEKRRIFD